MIRRLPTPMTLVILLICCFTTYTTLAQSEQPIIKLLFDEEAPPQNTGSVFTTFSSSAIVPSTSFNAAPLYNGTGLTSYNFGTTPGNYYVESDGIVDPLRSLTAFTLTGWLNCASNVTGAGGNRIISWASGANGGVDLVVQSDGSLKVGVNALADNSPAFSSTGKVPVSVQNAASNWVFFAVTYQSDGEVQFYFGDGTTAAVLDVTKNYNAGVPNPSIGPLAIGAFNSYMRSADTYDRMFKGLIDDVRIYGSALSLSDITLVQTVSNGDTTPPSFPGNLTANARTSTTISLSWLASTDNVELTGYDLYDGDSLLTSFTSTTTTAKLTDLNPGTVYKLTLKAKDAAGNTSSSNLISVYTDGGTASTPLVDLKMEQLYNLSNDGISATSSFGKSDSGIPTSSNNVPPGVGLQKSLDFGTTPANNYVEGYVDELRGLNAFTLTGWINNKSKDVGSGGNRILSWINNGGDGVDLVYEGNGGLQLGVNGWPDNSPALSSPNKVPTDPLGGISNWTFFAVTYQSGGNVNFYFGNDSTDAALDISKNYPRGAVGLNISSLAIGAFNNATRNEGTYDRMFRGLIDNIKIYGDTLSLADIRAVQRGTSSTDTIPPTTPTLTVSDLTFNSANLSWTASTDNVGVVEYAVFNNGTQIQTVQGEISTTLTNLIADSTYSFQVKARDAAGNISSISNAVEVTLEDKRPLVYVKFSEPNTFPYNSGSTGSSFTKTIYSTSAPVKVGAPLSTASGSASLNALDGLQNLRAFTITGWLNSRSDVTSAGGSPVVTSIQSNADGIDLVYNSDGSLQLGVDEWAASGGVKSSLNRITSDANESAANWVFFAVTYDANGETKFYFGNNATDAVLDTAKSYQGRGATGPTIGRVGIGLYPYDVSSPYSTNARFDGLIDDVQIFGSVRTLPEIIDIQRGPFDDVPPSAPADLISVERFNEALRISWSPSSDNIAVANYEVYNADTLITSYVLDPFDGIFFGGVTLSGLKPSTTYYLTVRAKDAYENLSAPSNELVVSTLGSTVGDPLVYLPMDTPAGSSVANAGSAPSSFFASSSLIQSNNVSSSLSIYSSDYGSTQNDNWVESPEPINELKDLAAFTLTGWLNNKSNVMGSGGNRIISWINGGGDGVDLVYENDGRLHLGVDQWPDVSPAFSSTNKVTTNAGAASSNWVFFAVTYKSDGQVQFYFGNNTADATLDVTRAYPGRGATGSNIGRLSIGAFNSATRNASTFNRMFRGLIDEIYVYNSVLTPQEIVAIQRGTGNASGRKNMTLPEAIVSEEPTLETELYQNFPNPFVSNTNVEMYLKSTVRVARVDLYDFAGRTLQQIDVTTRGKTSVTISSGGMQTGVYVYALIADGKVIGVKRMVVTK